VDQFEPDGARAVAAAFCSAFPDCSLWTGFRFQWVCWADAISRPVLRSSASRGCGASRRGARCERLRAPGQLGATFLADATQLALWYGDTPPLDDDHPKRIAAEVKPRPLDEYFSLLTAADARRRFESSRGLAAHWPAGLARATMPYFDPQPILNGHFKTTDQDLHLVDDFLRESDLRTPVLWLLGSDVPEQHALARRLRAAGPEEQRRPDYAYASAVGALADRNSPRPPGSSRRRRRARRRKPAPGGVCLVPRGPTERGGAGSGRGGACACAALLGQAVATHAN